MNTYLQAQTLLQTQTNQQKTLPPTPPRSVQTPRLPPQIEELFKQQLLQAAVGSGKELAADILDELVRSAWKTAAENPEALKQRLLGLLPHEQALYWHQQLTQLQNVTQIQSGFHAPPSTLIQPISPAATADSMLLSEMFQFFRSCNVPPMLALQWAKHVTPGFEPDRDLTEEELARIHDLMTNPQIEELVESVQSPLKSAAVPPPALLASNSPIVFLVQLAAFLVLLFMVLQIGGMMERQAIRSCLAVYGNQMARCLAH
jgi:hypothetical protein